MPSVEVLLSLSEAELNRHRLTHLQHYTGRMWYLTFKFSSQTVSPPARTYEREPEEAKAIGGEADIAALHFKSTDKWLYGVTMYSEGNATLFELMPEDQTADHKFTCVVSLLPGERIVAATLHTATWYAVKISVVVYEAI